MKLRTTETIAEGQTMKMMMTIAAILLMATTSMADATYNYTGNNFAELGGSRYTTAMSISISVTLSAALESDLSGFDARPLITSFTATDGVDTHTDAGQTVAMFFVDTNASGEVVGWNWYSSETGEAFIHSCTPSAGRSDGGSHNPRNDSLCDILVEPSIDWGHKYEPGQGEFGNTKTVGAWVTVDP